MTTTLTVDERQTLIARCYVALAEVDHDLYAWHLEVECLRLFAAVRESRARHLRVVRP